MNFRRFLSLAAALVAGLGITSQAHALYTFGGVDGGAANLSYTADNSNNPGGATANLTISGVSAANGGTYVNNTNYSIGGFASGATFTSNALQYYAGNGLGMASDGSNVPNHAMDNGPSTDANGVINGLGRTEGVLLNFSKSVVLSSVGIGYVSGDADISLFRWVGTGSPATLTGAAPTLSSMTSAGWELVGNYGDLVVDNTNPYNLVNAGNKGSSWWLISAYNTEYGTVNSGAGTLGQGNDYFKVYAVAGTDCVGVSKTCGNSNVNQTPEPNSLALVGLAVMGAYGVRRRKA